MVDKKKLEKAEAKALEKCAKREILESGMNKKKRPADLTATASQAANRRDARVDASGGNTMDIHLASVDVSIGTKWVASIYALPLQVFRKVSSTQVY